MTTTHEATLNCQVYQDELFDVGGENKGDSEQIIPLADRHLDLRSLNRPEQIEDIISKLPSDVQLTVRQALDLVSEYTKMRDSKVPLSVERKNQRQADIDATHAAAVEALSRLYGSDAVPYWLNIYKNRHTELGRALGLERDPSEDDRSVDQSIGQVAMHPDEYTDGKLRAAEGSDKSPWNQD